MGKLIRFFACLACGVIAGILVRYAGTIVAFGCGIAGNPFRPQIVTFTLLFGVINGVIGCIVAGLNRYQAVQSAVWGGIITFGLLLFGELIGLISRSGQLWNTLSLVVETDIIEIMAIAVTAYLAAVCTNLIETHYIDYAARLAIHKPMKRPNRYNI